MGGGGVKGINGRYGKGLRLCGGGKFRSTVGIDSAFPPFSFPAIGGLEPVSVSSTDKEGIKGVCKD